MIDIKNINDKLNVTQELEKKAQKFALENPLKEVMKMTQPRNLFIVGMVCDTQFDANLKASDKKKCENKEVIPSLQKNGICFTYFHKMATYKRANDNCKILDNCSKNVLGQFYCKFDSLADYEPHFDVNEIIRFELDFYPKEYTNTELPVSGRLSIHDNSEIGNSLSNAFNLEPGFYYQFFIKLQSTKMLKKPYATNCLDYTDKYFDQFNKTKDYAGVPLSRKVQHFYSFDKQIAMFQNLGMHICLYGQVHHTRMQMLASRPNLHSKHTIRYKKND